MTTRTLRWNVALVVALLASGTGVLFETPRLLYAAIPPVVFVAYGHATTAPDPAVEIERVLDGEPEHGKEVEIEVTIRNTGTRTLPDVRVVDGVPPMLSVVDGSARHATVLGPGEKATFSYTVLASHGVHRFEPATIVCRDTSGSQISETTATAETELVCRSPIRTLPFPISPRQAGATDAVAGESGIEFERIRLYRPGDPPGRINWRHYAKRGELTTVSFREDRRRTVLLCLDTRASCYRSADPNSPHGVFYERAAARELLETLAETNTQIGLATSGSATKWVLPRAGNHQVATVLKTLESVPLAQPENDRHETESPADILRSRLERGIDVVFLTPLADQTAVETARTLQESGHTITVLSPDVTDRGTRGRSIARLERENRIDALRRSDITVVDWHPGTPLETAIQCGLGR